MKTRLCNRFRSFEYLDAIFSNLKMVRVIAVYLPLPSSANKLTIDIFVDQFFGFLTTWLLHRLSFFFFFWDFTFHVDAQNDYHASRFIDILELLDIKQMLQSQPMSLGTPLTWLSQEQMLEIHLFITSLSLSSRSLTTK